jgi:hypothetical protein
MLVFYFKIGSVVCAGIDSVDRVFVTFGLIIKSDWFSWSFLNNLLMQQLLKTITL